MAEYESQEREDGKSDIWEIEKRMIATPGYNLPDRETLNRMFSIITMDADIRLHTTSEDLKDLWYMHDGLPENTVEEGWWQEVQDIAEDDQDYALLIQQYNYILGKR